MIESDLMPLIMDVPLALGLRGLGTPDTALEEGLPKRMSKFADRMDRGFRDILGPAGFPLDAEGMKLCSIAAQEWVDLAKVWNTSEATDLIVMFRTRTAPASLEALDGARRVFIDGVIKRQAGHAELSGKMMVELSNLSRAIQFVAINAAIEAARSGSHGRAFGLIAEEIRQLAQKSGSIIETQAT